MAESALQVDVRGLDELQTELRALPGKLRVRALANALRAGARLVRNEARRLTPVLTVPVRRRGRLIRKPGTVRDALSVRTSKRARRAGDVGVFVNVRPAKGKNRGAENPYDPFYWRWLEFGRNAKAGAQRGKRRVRPVAAAPAYRFLQGAVGKLPAALAEFERKLGPAITRLNVKRAPAP